MNAESDLRQQLRGYVDGEPLIGLSFERVVAEGRRSRRRRQLAAGVGVAAVILAAATVGVYAVGHDPDSTPGRHPEPATSSSADREAIRAAFAEGIRDRLDSGTARAGAIRWIGRSYASSHPEDAIAIQVKVRAEQDRQIRGLFTRGDSAPGMRYCSFYRWDGTTCRSQQVDGGVVLVIVYPISENLKEMNVILLRDDGTGNGIRQFNFDTTKVSQPGRYYPLTAAEAVSLVQDPALDYRG